MNWLRKRAQHNIQAPLQSDVASIHAWATRYSTFSDVELIEEMNSIRRRASDIKHPDIAYFRKQAVPMIFGIVREAAIRSLGVTPYETQIMAGLALYRGYVVEMGTGEGKTLAAPFAAVAQWAIHGRQVHICTANEYLAQRDATMLMPLYRYLGLAVAVSLGAQPPDVKARAYTCPVVYSTHTVLAQDFLREHLVRVSQPGVMPVLGAVIIDEADAAMIDEARMPVVLSADAPVQAGLYETLNTIAATFVRTGDEAGKGDFWVDGKDRIAILTEAGYERTATAFVAHGLMSSDAELYGELHQALLLKLCYSLSARNVLFKDQHYVVADGAIVLIDESTGRLVPGRRWDSGLQQALEAKEGVPPSPESLTLARISLQHFFKQYQALSGMTGTAMDDSDELSQVYGLPVVVIAPNKPSVRIDEEDRYYRTQAQKLDAVVADIAAANAKGQPVLIGTASVEQSNALSDRLRTLGITNEILNASQNSREAEIIANAGEPGAVTVSTNMAGRGVDIVLGGNLRMQIFEYVQSIGGQEAWEAMSAEDKATIRARLTADHAEKAAAVRVAGGLRVIGLERYESRRIDRQLRGRCARQGDPGQTCFYLSLEDTLVENFAGERIRGIFAALDIPAGDEFEGALVRRAVDAAQREVEGRTQSVRRELMAYDSVIESQRSVVYALRNAIRTEPGIDEVLATAVTEEGQRLVKAHIEHEDYPETWDLVGLREELKQLGVTLPETDVELAELDYDDILTKVVVHMQSHRVLRLEQVAPHEREAAQRSISLDMLDQVWMLHLDALATLRRGIHLRQHAKMDPRQAYAKEAYDRFGEMLDDLKRGQVRSALTWILVEA